LIARLRRQNGYSLVELITVMAILSVVMTALTTIFVSASKAQIDTSNRFIAEQNARVALDKLRRDIHCAYDATPAVGGTGHWSVAQSSVTLKSTSCADGDVTWCTTSVGGSTTRYLVRRLVVSGGGTCATNGVAYADYVTTSTPFTDFAKVTGCGCLPSLAVSFPISVGGGQVGTYKLQDTIFFRNAVRT
jgi:prepilin-type N-terminal cleavage/methylation domain-containing protein